MFVFFFFFFNDTATTEIYTLSLHDALPISPMTGVGDTIDATGAGVKLNGTALSGTTVGLRIRASNITIRGLIIEQMPNDGIRVETIAGSPTVTGVLLTGNTLDRNGSRGIRILGGTGPGKTVSASVPNNIVSDNLANRIQ